MEQILLTDLITKGRELIAKSGYNSYTIEHYHLHWNNLQDYFKIQGQVFFSDIVLNNFIADKKLEMNKGIISSKSLCGAQRAVFFLQEFCIGDGNITGTRRKRFVRRLNDSPLFESLLEEYTSYISEKLKHSTVQRYSRIAEEFLLFLKSRNFKCFKNVSQKAIKDVVKQMAYSSPNSMQVILPALRSFIRFLSQGDDNLLPLLWAIPKNGSQQRSLMSVVTDLELEKLDSYIREAGNSPQRDYAIFLLAARVGLRKSDIAGLTLDDIDWRQGVIRIVQQKSMKILEIPLLKDVGDALSSYILNNRPSTTDRHVFIRSLAPHIGISPSVCSHIVRSAMKQCGINEEAGKSQGTHCLRHSVAQKMLSESVPIPTITSILGHQSAESTRHYLSIDTSKLRFCALDFTGIKVRKEELL